MRAGGAKNIDRTLLFSVTLIQTSVMTVSFLSKHSSGPGCKRQPEGPHNSLGTFLQSVSGEYFKTVRCSVVQTSLGHVVHFCSVKIGNIDFTPLKNFVMCYGRNLTPICFENQIKAVF